jgi:hypothetical protein
MTPADFSSCSTHMTGAPYRSLSDIPDFIGHFGGESFRQLIVAAANLEPDVSSASRRLCHARKTAPTYLKCRDRAVSFRPSLRTHLDFAENPAVKLQIKTKFFR